MTTERVDMFCVKDELRIGAGYAAIAVSIDLLYFCCDPM
jgi:hypothetical protein